MTIGEREYERHRQTTPNGKLAESYFDLGGVRGPVCEVVDAMAEENERLRWELAEATAELARMRAVVEAARVCYSGECDMEHAHRQLKYAVRNYDASAGKGGK